VKKACILIVALALAACSGSFGTGGSGGMNPPTAPQAPASPGSAATAGTTPAPAPSGDTVTYPFSQAPSGMQCPTVNGYSCLLTFNAPAPTPTPTATPKGKTNGKSKAKPKSRPTATPTPTPTPSPSPSSTPTANATSAADDGARPSPIASGSAAPSPAGANVTFQLAALPKDAPAMVNPDPKALATTALIALRMHADGAVVLDGTAIAAFTLPKDQIGGRSYAIQLYQETVRKKHRDDRYVGTFSDSTLDGSTLRFVFTPPKLQIKKDEIWLFVLYSAETPSASAIPSGAPTSTPSASPSPTPTPTEEP
jgi:hypothetical protein